MRTEESLLDEAVRKGYKGYEAIGYKIGSDRSTRKMIQKLLIRQWFTVEEIAEIADVPTDFRVIHKTGNRAIQVTLSADKLILYYDFQRPHSLHPT